MKTCSGAVLVALAFLLCHCAPAPERSVEPAPGPGEVVGIHLLSWTSDSLLVELGKTIPSLAARGINLIILEVDYSFDFQSHPELRQGTRYITRKGARQFAEICRRHGIRLIPEFQSLGHQSWAGQTFPLLTQYPELDLTPGAFPENEGIYCREWDPTNPRVNEIVLPLIDEIIAAFGADGIHVGMDEIFLLDSEFAPNTQGQDPAALLARVLNEFHDHFVTQQGLEMFMWGDRLIDGTVHGYGAWESSLNGTAPAVDMIPKDIVICDWHYTAMAAYASIPMFLDKGFRVLPSSYQRVDAVQALIKHSYSLQHPGMIGHLFTTWGRLEPAALTTYPPMLSGIETLRSGRFYDVTFDVQPAQADCALVVTLGTAVDGMQINYSIDGSTPTLASPRYSQPVQLTQSTRLRAIASSNGVIASDVTQQQFVVHKALGREVTLLTAPSPKYPPRDGAGTLVNGVTGSTSYADGQWVGAEGTDLVVLLDLGGTVDIANVSLTSMNDHPNWVHHSPLVEVFGSTDGDSFQQLGEAADEPAETTIVPLSVSFETVTTRYVKVHIHNREIPAGQSGAGNRAWLFVDEIVID